MRYDFRKRGEEAQWAESHDGVVVDASPLLRSMFLRKKVEVLIAWCAARSWKAYVSPHGGGSVTRMDLEEIRMLGGFDGTKPVP